MGKKNAKRRRWSLLLETKTKRWPAKRSPSSRSGPAPQAIGCLAAVRAARGIRTRAVSGRLEGETSFAGHSSSCLQEEGHLLPPCVLLPMFQLYHEELPQIQVRGWSEKRGPLHFSPVPFRERLRKPLVTRGPRHAGPRASLRRWTGARAGS